MRSSQSGRSANSSAISAMVCSMPAMAPTCALRRVGARPLAATAGAAAGGRRDRRHRRGVGLADRADAGADVAQAVLAEAERVLVPEARRRHALIELQLGH